MSGLADAALHGVDVVRALRVLQRERLLEPLRPDRTLRSARETLALEIGRAHV